MLLHPLIPVIELSFRQHFLVGSLKQLHIQNSEILRQLYQRQYCGI